MLSRLNGWQRIGVVLTVFWLFFVFGSGLIGYANLETGHGPFVYTIPGQVVMVKKGTEGRCTQIDPDPKAPDLGWGYSVDEVLQLQRHCTKDHYIEGTPDETRQIPDRHVFHFGDILMAAIVPPVVVWLLLFVVVAAVRWIAGGFRPK